MLLFLPKSKLIPLFANAVLSITHTRYILQIIPCTENVPTSSHLAEVVFIQLVNENMDRRSIVSCSKLMFKVDALFLITHNPLYVRASASLHNFLFYLQLHRYIV